MEHFNILVFNRLVKEVPEEEMISLYYVTIHFNLEHVIEI